MTNTDTAKPTTKDRPIFVTRFRALPNVDPTHALRHMLKSALRLHGLQCLSCEEEINHATTTSSSDHTGIFA
jgi:hypothetical protein